MINNVINTVDDFLSEEECKEIIVQIELGEPVDTSEISKRIESMLHERYKLKGFHINKLSDIVCKKYDKTTKYKISWKTNKKSHFNIIIQLNNNYQNGFTQFSVADGEKYFQAPKKIGNITLFFSNVKHRQSPVEDGVRYTLETTVDILESKDFKKTLI